MQFLVQTKSSVSNRLNKLIAPREVATSIEPAEILFNPPPTSVKPIGRIALIVVTCALAFWWLTRPSEIAPINTAAPASSPSISMQPIGEVVVDIKGDVVTPGLLKLPGGSRVADAIAAAGGLKPGVLDAGVNLAEHLVDGQLIQVGASAPGSALTGDKRISLNNATAEQLDTLPGVGPVMASRIINYRQVHQHFSKIEELQQVQGIGPKLFAQLKHQIRL